jgi:hypothetical protein
MVLSNGGGIIANCSELHQAFQDSLLAVMATLGGLPFGFHECLLECLALVAALRTFRRLAELANVAVIDFIIVWTVSASTEGIERE